MDFHKSDVDEGLSEFIPTLAHLRVAESQNQNWGYKFEISRKVAEL